MNTKRNFDWPTLISQQVDSGEGVAQFCRDNNLNSKSFYNNRAKLSATQTTTAFIKVETQVPLPQTLRLTVGQLSLELPMNVEPKWLAALLRESL